VRATATSFPLSKHTRRDDIAPSFSGRHVYLQFTWEVGLLPSPVEFSSHRCFYKLSHSWLLGVCHCSCLLQLAYEGFPSLPLQHSGHPTLVAMCLFCCYCLLFSFFFPLGRGQSVQGTMLIWPGVVCLSTMYHLAHLVVRVFPSRLGAGVWQQHGGPPGFSV
jgi:hypothetical protein